MNLSDTFYLSRAGRYSNPKNTNDRLPLPYGDLTDGNEGIWQLPCINVAGYVYCFAGFPVLSTGNSISIYINDILCSPTNYSFNPSNNYEGKGNIATITFTADQAASTITARGKGWASGGVLVENIVDVVDNFLITLCGFDAGIFASTFKYKARQIFDAQGYKAAGLLKEDREVWAILQEMMGSFLGSAFLRGDGTLALAIDDNTLINYEYGGIVHRSETVLLSAVQRLDNLINQCPCSYGYNYAKGEFRHSTDDINHADTASQGIYGVRKPNNPYPFYWSRDMGTVQTVQDLIVSKFAKPIWEIEVRVESLKYIHLDVMDVGAFSIPELFSVNGKNYSNKFLKILSVIPDYAKGAYKFRLLDTDYSLTKIYYADGTHLADGSILAGGNKN